MRKRTTPEDAIRLLTRCNETTSKAAIRLTFNPKHPGRLLASEDEAYREAFKALTGRQPKPEELERIVKGEE